MPPPPHGEARKFCVTGEKTGYYGTDGPEWAPQLEAPCPMRRPPSPTRAVNLKPRSFDSSHSMRQVGPLGQASFHEKPSTSRMAQGAPHIKPEMSSSFGPTVKQEHFVPEETFAVPKQEPLASTGFMPVPQVKQQPDLRHCPPQALKGSHSIAAEEPEVYGTPPETLAECPQRNRSMSLLPTEHFCARLRQLQKEACVHNYNVPELNNKAMDVFVTRLKEIDEHDESNLQLKLITFQDWVEILVEINSSLIENRNELYKQLEEFEFRSKACAGAVDPQLRKTQNDMCKLLSIIQKAYHCQEWDVNDVNFETITMGQVFGQGFLGSKSSPRLKSGTDGSPNEKYLVNMKALTLEVASKHDEIGKLKRVIANLENEIQNAQKKIQLKDDFIKELRNDVERSQTAREDNSTVAGGDTYRISCQTNESDLDSTRDRLEASYNYLCYSESLVQKEAKQLEVELNELLEIFRRKSAIAIPEMATNEAYKPILEIFHRLHNDKVKALRRLDHLRSQLAEVDVLSQCDSQSTVCDSPASEKCQADEKIIDSIRKSLQRANERMVESRRLADKCHMEKSAIEISWQTENKVNERNKEVLKQIADLLCTLSGKYFTYTDMYKEESNDNPFLEAITQLCSEYQSVLAKNKENLKQKSLKINELEDSVVQAKQQEKALNGDTSSTNTTTVSQMAIVNTTQTTTIVRGKTMATSITNTTASTHNNSDIVRSNSTGPSAQY